MNRDAHWHWFWVGLFVVLFVAAFVRFASFQFSLPYVDHPDEPAYFVGGQEWRGLLEPIGYYDGIPPAYVALHMLIQPVLESAGQSGLAATTLFMRGVSVVVNLLTLVIIALSARMMAGSAAGIIAGASWGFSPLVLENGVYALPDPFIYFFTVLAFWCAALAWQQDRRHYAIWSVVSGLAAVLMKYPALPALLPGVLVGAAFALRRPRQWRWLMLQLLLIGLEGFWLVFIYGVDFTNLQREGAVVQSQGLSNMLNMSRVIHNLGQTFEPLGLAYSLVVLFVGIAAYLYSRRHNLPVVSVPLVGLGLSVILGFPWLASSYSLVMPVTVRYVLPAAAVVCVFVGISIGQLLQIAHFYQARLPILRWSAALVLLALVLLVWFPQLVQDWRLVQSRRLPDTRVQLRQWFDLNLDPGTVIVDIDNHKTFNPIWGGIPHRRWVDWWLTSSLLEHSLQEWRDGRGMSYAVLSLTDIQEFEQTLEGQAYLSQMLRLRDFSGAESRGPQMALFRLWRMQYEVDVQFGDAIHLIGYDQIPESPEPGDPLTFRFYWKASQTPLDNYSLFIHLTPLVEYRILAQTDGAPAVPDRPTLTWNDPTETLISSPLTITIPASLEAGDYRVFVGLYNYVTGERLPVGAESAFLLTTVSLPG